MFKRIKVIAHAWGHYECSSLAAGVAFYAALSLFPLMMVVVAAVGYFFRFMPEGPSAREEILALLSKQMSVEFSESMSKLLMEVQDRALTNGPLAGVAFLFAASLMFAQIDRGFYRIWNVRRRTRGRGVHGMLRKAVTSRARSFAIIVAICLMVNVLFLVGLGLRTLGRLSSVDLMIIPEVSRYSSLVVGTVINVIVLTLLYRFLSKEKVTWKISLIGGSIAAGLWDLGSRILTAFSFSSNFSVYGLIGSFLFVLVWIYYTVMILFVGALIVRIDKRILHTAK